MFDWPARMKTLSGLPCAEMVVGEKQQTTAIHVNQVGSSRFNLVVGMDRSFSG